MLGLRELRQPIEPPNRTSIVRGLCSLVEKPTSVPNISVPPAASKARTCATMPATSGSATAVGACSVGADAELSHRADDLVSHPYRRDARADPQEIRDARGSGRVRHRQQKWLTSRSAPTPLTLEQQQHAAQAALQKVINGFAAANRNLHT